MALENLRNVARENELQATSGSLTPARAIAAQASGQAVNVIVKLPNEAIAISEKLIHAIAQKLQRKDYETHQEQVHARE
jgi:hypothetical protein